MHAHRLTRVGVGVSHDKHRHLNILNSENEPLGNTDDMREIMSKCRSRRKYLLMVKSAVPAVPDFASSENPPSPLQRYPRFIADSMHKPKPLSLEESSYHDTY